MARPSNVAGEKRGSPAMDFVIDQLRRNPNAVYSDVAAAARSRGYQIWPVFYGRAQALLGILKDKKRGGRRTAAATSTVASQNGRRRVASEAGSRPRSRSLRSAQVDIPDFDAMIKSLNTAMADLARYRRALEDIAEIARRAVG